jgi:hypothetical protein
MFLNLLTANMLAMEVYYVPVNPNQIAVGPDEFQREFVKNKRILKPDAAVTVSRKKIEGYKLKNFIRQVDIQQS